jgi:peroxiredoxin
MVATKSNMVPLGTIAPSFSLLDPRYKKNVSFSMDTKGKGFIIAFICNHCPFVIHLKEHFTKLFNEFHTNSEINVYAISSNDSLNYPDDAPDKMAIESERLGLKFPYLFDEDQKVAKSYGASCTPDFYLFDEQKKLFYRGQYDDSRPGNAKKVTGKDISNAVNLMLHRKDSPVNQMPSIGCNIKWKK